jgi:hypothetical protein
MRGMMPMAGLHIEPTVGAFVGSGRMVANPAVAYSEFTLRLTTAS